MSDTEDRRAIREDLDATLVVEAAAGTGKTTEMIARIIASLRAGVSTLDRIVAVTFTEKAAGEMKLRLRTELDRARQAAAGVERDRLERALAELEVARIGTIHGFCADLLRERPIEARIDPLFEVLAEDAAERLFQQAFEGWFQACVAEPGEGVRRFLRRASPAEALRAAGWRLVDRRDFTGAWRRDPFDREAAIDGVVAALAELAPLATAARDPDDFLARHLVEIARWHAELVRREAVQCRDYDGLEVELTKTIGRLWTWPYGGRGALFGEGVLRADVIAKRDAAKALLDAFVVAAEADLAALLREELRPLVAAYEHQKARTGQLDFHDLLARSRALLRDDATVRAELAARYTHFYVDEFQDTDPLQVEILLLLCGDPVAPGKLFVVGDPKQAIYRFRRADIALYHDVVARLLAGGARLLHLTTSYRSAPAIQSLVNAAFAPVMQGGTQASYVPLEPFRADVATRPHVIALPVPHPYSEHGKLANRAIEESYADAVGAFLDWLIHKSGWTIPKEDGTPGEPLGARHVCLIFRRFQSYKQDLTQPYVRALEARGIPHVLVGGRSFHEREEVVAVRNALAAIEWPDDALSVYATLRGPLFAFHDEDLLAFRHKFGALVPRPQTDRTAVADALALLGELHARRNRRPIADTLARLLAATRAHAGLAVWQAGEQALANVLRVTDLARRFEAQGATSFRAFVERLEADAARGRAADALVVEEGTDGVRLITAHSVKGLEFPVVILCDPTAPGEANEPSRLVDPARGVWLEAIAGCVPAELRAREAEVRERDREELVRLAYVAATRARDLLVVPVVGDEERPGWLAPLSPAVYPISDQRRAAMPAIGCPPFKSDSVLDRPDRARGVISVAPGRHTPRAGTHAVTWWDPRALELGKTLTGGMRQRQILEADEARVSSTESVRAHAAWQQRRATALIAGALPSVTVQSVTEAASGAEDETCAIARTDVARGGRPGGTRFGRLVHAILAAVDLRGGDVARLAEAQARLIGASEAEVAAAITSVRAALAHPLLVRAAAAAEVRREAPIVLAGPDGVVEGVLDLAFREGDAWTVVDFKTDAEITDSIARYAAQVRMYAAAITAATGQAATGTLLVV